MNCMKLDGNVLSLIPPWVLKKMKDGWNGCIYGGKSIKIELLEKHNNKKSIIDGKNSAHEAHES